MAFGGKVHHGIGGVQRKDAVKCHAVADVGLFKAVKVRGRDRGHVVKACGIGEGIQIDDLMPLRHGKTDHCRANEPCATSHQKFHAGLHSNGL